MRNLEKFKASLFLHFGQNLTRNQIVNVIGYGSGVFPQSKNSNITENTLDLIITVKDSDLFHQNNIRRNPYDYQGLGNILGSNYLNYLSKKLFPIHFNHIAIDNTKVKYGVITQNLFLKDLIDWNLLTVAGRMHKPTAYLTQLDNQTRETIYTNRRYALNVALLLMIKRQKISIIDLYMKIAEISYMGDIRYTVNVQNINKVKNIVENNLDKFNEIYFPLFKELANHAGDNFKFNGINEIQMSLNPKLLAILLSKGGFPRQFYIGLNQKFQIRGFQGDLARQFLVMGVPQIKTQLQAQITKVNRYSSMKMAGNTFLGGSLITNATYLFDKIKKKMH